MSRRSRASSAAARDEAGFTLIELIVAMGVFGTLMAIVGGAMLSGFLGVHEVMSRTDAQASAQIAGEWTGKLLRYAAVPEGQTTSITEASPTSITLFTYSGTGPKHDVPYRARIFVVTNADGSRSLTTSVWTPLAISGGWTWATAPVTRTHLTVAASARGPVSIAVWVRNPLTVPAAEPRLATPVASGPLVLVAGEQPESVVVQIGDLNDPRNVVTHQVRLDNVS